MSLTVSPNQSDIQNALRAFLISVLPAGVDAFEGLDNRVPEPSASPFVVFTMLRRRRLATNLDSYLDSVFTGSIANNVLTVTATRAGSFPIAVGRQIFGPGLVRPTTVTALGAGTGGVGTYLVTPGQTIASEVMSAGTETFEQATEVVFQIDVHAADPFTAGDMAQAISTMFRDGYAMTIFGAPASGIAPLHADEPRQLTFINAEDQFENRYMVEVYIQANQVVSGVPQEFWDTATLELVDVDARPTPVISFFILDTSALNGPDILG